MTINRNDHGNVVVEYIAIALFLIVPIFYIADQCSIVARTYLEVVSASNSAVRAYAVQGNDSKGLAAAKNVIAEEFSVAGVQLKNFSMKVKCSSKPCLVAGHFVTISIEGTTHVSVPLLSRLTIPVGSSQTMEVDEAR